jgi:hypothetical protein
LISSIYAQKVDEIKTALEKTKNPIQYTSKVLHKRYEIDTIEVISTTSFQGLPDSIAYYGKIGKVYGPYKGPKGKYLIQVLAKAPNTFYHLCHILIDTSVFQKVFADSLATRIIENIQSGISTFESMAHTYSSDLATASKGGDLGWLSKEAMLPDMSRTLLRHKKGDIFKMWTSSGLHIVYIKEFPKSDTGYTLMLKIIL